MIKKFWDGLIKKITKEVIVGVIVTYLVSYFTIIKWQVMLKAIQDTANKMIYIEFPLWKFILIIIGIIVIGYIILHFTPKAKNVTKVDEKDNFEYKQERFGIRGSKWSWSQKIQRGILIVEHLNPNCPTCNSEMHISETPRVHPLATCSKCRLDGRQYEYHIHERPEDIKDEILRRINEKLTSKS